MKDMNDNYFDSAQHDRDVDDAYHKLYGSVDHVHIWPDGTWCHDEDLYDYLDFMSDDYVSTPVAFVSVYKAIAGWKAVLYTWSEDPGMHEPEQTGHFAYGTKEEAEADARVWAKAEELPCMIYD